MNSILGTGMTDTDHTKVINIIVSCACNRDITLNELRHTYPHRKKEHLQKFLPYLNATMKRYEITTCLRKAHFLAQIGHESAELQYTAEVGISEDYEKKHYKGYKGRGLIQLTFPKNYMAYSHYIKQDLTGDNRIKLEEPELATDSAGWYWRYYAGPHHNINLNAAADQNDLIYITANVNGGLNGYETNNTSRLNLLKNAIKAFKIVICPHLNTLFNALPEVEKFSYESYSLEKSKAYDDHDMSFAWGYWHDPQSKMYGTQKIVKEAKLGYHRYLQLLTTTKKAILKKGRFYLTRDQMKIHAETRLKHLQNK